jgi:hypothetical protein
MRVVVKRLLKEYYELTTPTVKDTIIIGQAARQIVRVVTQRRSVAWDILDERRKYSDRLALQLCDQGQERIAQQLYLLTQAFLLSKRKEGEAFLITRMQNVEKTSHERKVYWCVTILASFGVIGYHDVMELSSLEQDDVSYGFRRIAQSSGDEENKERLQEAEDLLEANE